MCSATVTGAELGAFAGGSWAALGSGLEAWPSWLLFSVLEVMAWKCKSKGCGIRPRAFMTLCDLCPLTVIGAISLLLSVLKREETSVTRSTLPITLLMIDFVLFQSVFSLWINS